MDDLSCSIPGILRHSPACSAPSRGLRWPSYNRRFSRRKKLEMKNFAKVTNYQVTHMSDTTFFFIILHYALLEYTQANCFSKRRLSFSECFGSTHVIMDNKPNLGPTHDYWPSIYGR